MELPPLDPVAKRFYGLWHRAVLKLDFEALKEVIHDNVEFHTPVYMKPRLGKKIVVAVLMAAASNFQNFEYEREWLSPDGLNWVLEFKANVDGKPIKGVDIIRTDKEGKIVHMEVMMRPIKGIARFAELQAEAIPRMIKEAWGPDAKL
ncbi:hypothetical protein HDU96_003146 [Phlyctochytrium bullatum]|nr:hypothetical protein HDU96_003146 [Phlyctochytrium bullatum]